MSETPLAPGTEAANARLDRLERETFRRKWDSTVLSAGQRVGRETSHSRETPGPPPILHGSFVDLLNERLDRLESKTQRLEREFGRLARKQHFWRRVAGTLTFVAVVAAAVSLAQSWARSPARPNGGPWSTLASLTGWEP